MISICWTDKYHLDFFFYLNISFNARQRGDVVVTVTDPQLQGETFNCHSSKNMSALPAKAPSSKSQLQATTL